MPCQFLSLKVIHLNYTRHSSPLLCLLDIVIFFFWQIHWFIIIISSRSRKLLSVKYLFKSHIVKLNGGKKKKPRRVHLKCKNNILINALNLDGKGQMKIVFKSLKRLQYNFLNSLNAFKKLPEVKFDTFYNIVL